MNEKAVNPQDLVKNLKIEIFLKKEEEI